LVVPAGHGGREHGGDAGGLVTWIQQGAWVTTTTAKTGDRTGPWPAVRRVVSVTTGPFEAGRCPPVAPAGAGGGRPRHQMDLGQPGRAPVMDGDAGHPRVSRTTADQTATCRATGPGGVHRRRVTGRESVESKRSPGGRVGVGPGGDLRDLGRLGEGLQVGGVARDGGSGGPRPWLTSPVAGAVFRDGDERRMTGTGTGTEPGSRLVRGRPDGGQGRGR
jgi:hypothetical protein